MYSAHPNFVRIFYLVTGVTLTEYIRNRRLSLAIMIPEQTTGIGEYIDRLGTTVDADQIREAT